MKSICMLSMSTALAVFIFICSQQSYAFSVDKFPTPFDNDPIHENITREALRNVNRGLSAEFINSVNAGNRNMDVELDTHKFIGLQHVNSANSGNRIFDQSNSFILNMISTAASLAENNSRFFNPRMYSYSLYEKTKLAADVVFALGPGVVLVALEQPNSPVEYIRVPARLTTQFSAMFSMKTDPHGYQGRVMGNLRKELEEKRNRLRRENKDLSNEMKGLILEIKAHQARQYLGHAFHTLQDFAAHSNAIELIHGKNGPPCSSDLRSLPICDSRIGSGGTQRFGGRTDKFLRMYRADTRIDNNNLLQIFGEQTFNKLQTGYVKPGENPARPKNWYCDNAGRQISGLDYCHWTQAQFNVPGLNKDKNCSSTDGCEEAAHANHPHAYKLAVYMTEILYEKFLQDSGRAGNLPNLSIVNLVNNRPLPNGVNAFVNEADHLGAAVKVQLSEPAPYNVTFSYALEAINPNSDIKSANTRCGDGADFLRRSGHGVISKGESQTNILLNICNDNDVEGNDALGLFLRDVRMVRGSDRRDFNIMILSDDREPRNVIVHGQANSKLQKQIQTEGSSSLTNPELSCSVRRCPKGQIPRKDKLGRCNCR